MTPKELEEKNKVLKETLDLGYNTFDGDI